MAFLDNSGDIILDAVLTDTGRMRLARGDGTFRIVKFALGDDEINYGLFDKNHESGSAYYDLAIMQTPVLEAFTNNTSILKHKLLSMPQTNLLYLPVVKLNDVQSAYKAAYVPPDYDDTTGGASGITATQSDTLGKGIYFLAADEATMSQLKSDDVPGILSADRVHIRTHQGLDTDEISFTRPDALGSLKETQYIIQADNRLALVVNSSTDEGADPNVSVSYIDDDQIASYYLSMQDKDYVGDITPNSPNLPPQIIKGPPGTYLQFNLTRTPEIETSTALFAELGGGAGSVMIIDGINYLYIDTNVRVTGATTGSSIDIPVRVLKKQ